MEKTGFFLLVCLLTCTVLAACGPSQAELDAQATRVAADVFATQTAEAMAAISVPTDTPAPLAKPTSTPLTEKQPTETPAHTPYLTYTPYSTHTPLPAPALTPRGGSEPSRPCTARFRQRSCSPTSRCFCTKRRSRQTTPCWRLRRLWTRRGRRGSWRTPYRRPRARP